MEDTSTIDPGSRTAESRRLTLLLRELVAEEDAAAVLERVVSTLRQLVWCDDVVVWEHDTNGELVVAVVEGEDAEEIRDLRIRVGEGLTGLAAAEAAAIVSNDAHLDERAGLVPGTEVSPEAIACLPLVARDRLLGVLTVYRRGRRRRFASDEVELLGDFAALAALALENARTRAELEELATTDDLTGLANRRQFHRVLEREIALARRHRTPLSVILLDLDRFKQVNDSFGHHVGDQALRGVAEVLRSRLRSTDCPARLGGDEFAVVLPHTTQVQAERVAAELAAAIEAAAPPPVGLSVSSGVSGLQASHRDTNPADTLLVQADRLLYEAKGTTRRGVHSLRAKVPPATA
jgi:diguanylate cyclase (GGDEF)-like protein